MSAQDWKPPATPDPSSILHSAVGDRREGRFAQALAKHVWYHNNAVRLEPSQFGVRLSFALGYWMQLSQEYPEALAALIQTRDEAERAFLEKSSPGLFMDVAALNSHLDQQHLTVELFERIALADESNAASIYHLAEDYLVAAGRYDACRPYLQLVPRMERAVECYRRQLSFENSGLSVRGVSTPKLARRNFVYDIATFAALLVHHDRATEARQACEQATEVLQDEHPCEELAAALEGIFPSSDRK